MIRIGILSDTHGTIPKQVYSFFEECDEIWHAGDIGPNVLDKLREFKPVVAVFGNCDGWEYRYKIPETQLFVREGKKIIMTHIGGRPGNYPHNLLPLFESEKPDIFVCGHSHILRIMYDNVHNFLHINPGAAGRQGIHKDSTLVRFTLDGEPKDMQICKFDKF